MTTPLIEAKKPCPRCTGEEVTFANADRFKFCNKHMSEIFRELWGKSRISAAQGDG